MKGLFSLLLLNAAQLAAAMPQFDPFYPKYVGSAEVELSLTRDNTEKDVNGPGFVTVYPSFDNSSNFDLFISSFGMFSQDKLFQVQNIGSKMSAFSSISPVETRSVGKHPLNWPNSVTQPPKEVFGAEGVLVAGGFLPPGKQDGGLWFAPFKSDGSLGDLTNVYWKRGWFYHLAVPFDINGDGTLELLSCRARKPMIPFLPSGGKLVYLSPKDPSKPGADGPGWTEYELADGCDVYFELADLDGDGVMEIVGTDFFKSRQITLFWTEDPKGDFTKSIKSRPIETSIGSPFDVRFVDLNGDGKLDLLASNHAKSGEKPSGSVYAYEIPENYKVDTWKRRTLATNIPVRQSGPFEAAPGTAQPFVPNTIDKFNKPWIMVAGDGSQQAFYLVPKDDSNPENWEYSENLLYDCQSVVGGIAIEDVNNDGYAEVFVPCYYSGKINAFTFAP